MRLNCHHGTTRDVAEKILSTGHFFVHSKPHHWLGPGAYFFQEAPLRAWAWALWKAKRTPGSEPAVIEIELDIEPCFDLLDVTNYIYIDKAHQDYQQRVECGELEATHQQPPIVRRPDGQKYYFFSSEPTNDRWGNNLLDNEIIKLAVSNYEEVNDIEVSAVRAAFIEGTEVFENSFFYDHYHVQIAVMNNEIIDPNSNRLDPRLNFQILGIPDLNERYRRVRRKHWAPAWS